MPVVSVIEVLDVLYSIQQSLHSFKRGLLLKVIDPCTAELCHISLYEMVESAPESWLKGGSTCPHESDDGWKKMRLVGDYPRLGVGQCLEFSSCALMLMGYH